MLYIMYIILGQYQTNSATGFNHYKKSGTYQRTFPQKNISTTSVTSRDVMIHLIVGATTTEILILNTNFDTQAKHKQAILLLKCGEKY